MKRSLPLSALFGVLGLLALTGVSCPTSKAADGGAFASFDQGEAWQQRVFVRTEGKKTIAIDKVNVDSIVIDPKDEKTLYLTSRENGIFKSTNQGESWTQTGLTGGRVRSFSIDPTDTNVMYATLDISIMKSVDGGTVWTEVLKDAAAAQMTNVLVDSFDSKIVWATTGTGTVYQTIDAGKNWQVNTRFLGGVRWLASSNDDTRVIYASVADDGLYKTTNKGRSWEKDEILFQIRNTANVTFLEVDQQNKDIVYIYSRQGLLKTTDGGKTWDQITTLLGEDSDQNDLVTALAVFHPNMIIFSVNNVLHKSTNGGNTWRTITTFPSTKSIQDLTIDPETKTTIYAGVLEVKEKGGLFTPIK